MINDNDDVKPQNYTAPEYMFKQWNIYLCIVVQEFHMNSCTHGIRYKFSEQIAYFDISSCLKWHVKSFSDSHMNFKHKLQLGAEITNWTIKAGLGMLLNFDIHSCFFYISEFYESEWCCIIRGLCHVPNLAISSCCWELNFLVKPVLIKLPVISWQHLLNNQFQTQLWFPHCTNEKQLLICYFL